MVGRKIVDIETGATDGYLGGWDGTAIVDVDPVLLRHREVMMSPKKMEEELRREAEKKGLKGERKDAYIYGTLRKTGWKPKKEKR